MQNNTLKLLALSRLAGQSRLRAQQVLRRSRLQNGSFEEDLELFSGSFGDLSKERQILENCSKFDIAVIPIFSVRYPTQLLRLDVPPLILYVRGRRGREEFPSRSVAIVGSRRGDARGVAHTRELSRHLRGHGFTLVSGLAYGIDSACHWAALESPDTLGIPTIAVMPCGLDNIYPRAHEKLARAIFESDSLIVSEYPPGEAPLPYRFLERNRIVAGLSRAVVVVQAAAKSGALSTARHAAEAGIDVFTPPGMLEDPLYGGNHQLLQCGAFLLSSFEEFYEHLGISARETGRSSHRILAQQILRFLLEQGPKHYRELRTKFGNYRLAETLLELESVGRLECSDGIVYRALGEKRHASEGYNVD
ncbi:MAG: DNA-processing protein DprA [Bdellovibrionales bacterium]|nr:DNA-processing protein DprA [Bdellovibrionales bacterium]